MKKFAVILFIYILPMPAFAEQYSIPKNEFFTSSESLASEMGKTFQLAQNCGQSMAHIAAPSAAILFLNYFEEQEVKIIMRQYQFSVAREKGKSCNHGKVAFHLLMNKIAIYIRLAAHFSKNK